MAGTNKFRHLNRDGLWPGFHWSGLELDTEGVLRLMALPRLEGALPEAVRTLAAATLPGGLAADIDGAVYFTDPATHHVFRLNGCSGTLELTPCLGGEGSAPTQFRNPAGLHIPGHRHALYVADAGNGRIQIFDLESLAVIEIWTGFGTPVSLASDSGGNTYVVDTKTHRIDRFGIAGDRADSFWANIARSNRMHDPRAVAIEDDTVYVLDGNTHHVCLFDTTGHLLGVVVTGSPNPSGLAVKAGAIYLGDNDTRRIGVYRRNAGGSYFHSGDAAGYEGPVAALAIEPRGGLLVSPGGGLAPLRLSLDGSHRNTGLLWSDALSLDAAQHFWNRLHATIELPAATHVQFFLVTKPPAPPVNPSDPLPFPAPWRAIGVDITDFFIGGDKTSSIWIGAQVSNDAHGTPALAQLRLDFDQESYLTDLPFVYRGGECDNFLLRFLSLFESFFGEMESHIDAIPALLDPQAAPHEVLPWLASFLALDLPESWSDAQQRAAIAKAFERYGRRGTAAALIEVLSSDAGVRAVIDEPIQNMGWWSMPAPSASCEPAAAGQWIDGADSVLGFNTVLASAEPQGAVAGTTAILDQAQLISSAEFGTTLFDSAAYQFTVQVYRSEIDCPGRLERVRAVLDREKPAHTTYQLCVIEPGVRIGYKSRLGIDTVIGGEPAPGRLGEGDLVLAGHPRGRIGVRSQLGQTTQL